jgi:type IV secretory pathway VirB2 component (pilin)
MIVVTANAVSRREEVRQWIRAFLYMGLILVLLMVVQSAYASDGTEFEEAAAKFEGWVKGNLGKLAALVAIAVGSVVAAVRKDWSWFFGALVLAIGIGIVVGIVNASFTAVI